MESTSLLGFLIDLAAEVFAPNGKQEDLYDVNFSNHYKSLYDFKKKCEDEGVNANIDTVIQDRKSKSVQVKFKEPLNSKNTEQIMTYCDQNKIDYDINKNKINSITINKQTKGVLEERKWKKEM